MGTNVFGKFSTEGEGSTPGPSPGAEPLLGQHEEGGGRDGEHDPSATR